jgi:hypothetical protein
MPRAEQVSQQVSVTTYLSDGSATTTTTTSTNSTNKQAAGGCSCIAILGILLFLWILGQGG